MSDIDETEVSLNNEAMSADEIPERPPRLFGQVVNVDTWACVLIKGQSKVMFDPAKHDPDKRSIAITIEVQSIANNTIKKKEWVHWSPAWKKITLPSLKAAGLDLNNLRGKYIASDYAPTGRTYTSKVPDDAPKGTVGEVRQEFTFKFFEAYADRDQCEAASRMYRAGVSADELGDIAAEVDAAAAAVNGTSPNGTSTGGEANGLPPVVTPANVATQAVKAMWRASGEDTDKFGMMFAKNPKIASQFKDAKAALDAINVATVPG